MRGYEWNGWHCRISDGEKAAPTAVLILGDEATELLETLAARFPGCCLIGACPPAWNDCCTPWPAPGLRRKDPPFGGGAGETLSFLTERLLPWARTVRPLPQSGQQMMLAGYSLAGLTSLYGLYHGLPFGRYASLSGSLWYPGWTEYAQNGTAAPGAQVYLSLGRNEPNSRHPLLRTVGEATETMAGIAGRQLGSRHVCFQWNEGGHFSDYAARYERALHWAWGDSVCVR